ncbi:MAG: NADH-quinone oxidoreductase subunit NuoE [bacterium]
MLISKQARLREEVRELADQFGHNRSALLPILQQIQHRHYHISEYAMQVVADFLGIHPTEVYGVVSFYSFLNREPRGRFEIRLCKTISCAIQESQRVARQLENDLGIKFGETTPDGKFSLDWANCIGMCDQGPGLLVNDQVFTRVTPEKVHDIVEGLRRTLDVYSMQNVHRSKPMIHMEEGDR